MVDESPTAPARLRKQAETIARAILNDAEAQGLRPGDQLATEAQMAPLYKSGRISVREALRILEVHGIVVIEKGRGNGPRLERLKARSVAATLRLYFQYHHATYADVLDARTAIEPQLARRAAERGRAAQKRKVVEYQRALLAERDDYNRIGTLGRQFMYLVGDMAHSPCLAVLNHALSDIQTWRTYSWFENAAYWEPARRRLHELGCALLERDSSRAEETVRQMHAAEGRLLRRAGPGILSERVYWD